jgi:uncharacterized membrane protein YebE (DUF533 family)
MTRLGGAVLALVAGGVVSGCPALMIGGLAYQGYEMYKTEEPSEHAEEQERRKDEAKHPEPPSAEVQ